MLMMADDDFLAFTSSRRFSESQADDVLSNRAKLLARENCFLAKHLAQCNDSPWSAKENPGGYVNLGTAENVLCEDLLVEKFTEPGFYEFNAEMLRYYSYHGTASCRIALSKFISRYFKSSVHLDPEKLILILGTCSALDILAHVTADPGDVFMCPSPYYTRIRADVFERGLVEIVNVDMVSKDQEKPDENFRLTVDQVKEAYETSINNGDNIKGIILLNPNNPLGTIYTKKELMPIFTYAAEQQLYVIVDEIYGLSVFDKESAFESVLSYWDELPDPARVFWLWGFSKDFGNAGLRASVMYIEKPSVLVGVKKLATYQCVPLLLHSMIEKFVSDFDWLDNIYFCQNSERLRSNYAIVTEWLERLKIKYCKSRAGFFVFAFFGPYLEDQTQADEKRLFDFFFNAGVYIVPGSELYCSEPGWFRIIFTAKPEALKEGLRRMESVLSIC